MPPTVQTVAETGSLPVRYAQFLVSVVSLITVALADAVDAGPRLCHQESGRRPL